MKRRTSKINEVDDFSTTANDFHGCHFVQGGVINDFTRAIDAKYLVANTTCSSIFNFMLMFEHICSSRTSTVI